MKKKRFNKTDLVSRIIKIRCVLKIFNSQSEFELNLAWRILLTLKRRNLIQMYEQDLFSLLKSYNFNISQIPNCIVEAVFPSHFVVLDNKLEVSL